MRLTNLALAVTAVDLDAGQLFIGDVAVKADKAVLTQLVQSQLGEVTPESAPRRGPGRPKAAATAAPVKRGPGRPPKSQVQAAPEKRGPGRPKKELTEVKKVTKGTKGEAPQKSAMALVWEARRARVKKGFCAMCTDDTKHIPGSDFCKSHFKRKYPNKPLPKVA